MMVYDPVMPYNHRTVHDDASARLAEWRADFMEKSAQPDITKVGPHGYIHGWIKVGAGDGGDGAVLGNTHHPLTGARGQVAGPEGSHWLGLAKDGTPAKSREEAVAAVNDKSGNMHSLREGDNFKTIGSVGQHDTKPGYVSYPMSSMHAQGNKYHTTRDQAVKRVVNEWQKTLPSDDTRKKAFISELSRNGAIVSDAADATGATEADHNRWMNDPAYAAQFNSLVRD